MSKNKADMVSISSDFIERYQKIYEKSPNSRIFAPLAEAYRRMGLLDEAYKLCEQGVKEHPEFAGGRVAMAKVLIDQNMHKEAVQHLQKATSLAPENILAHQLLADLWLKLRKSKQALAAYKMVLLLNPLDNKAKKVVRKLESLTADEYEDDLFEMQPLVQLDESSDFISKKLSDNPETNPVIETANRLKGMERLISLADAFIARNDTDKAEQTLDRAEKEFGAHPEVLRRKELLQQRGRVVTESPSEEVATQLSPLPTRHELAKIQKKELLERLLLKFENHRQGRIDSL